MNENESDGLSHVGTWSVKAVLVLTGVCGNWPGSSTADDTSLSKVVCKGSEPSDDIPSGILFVEPDEQNDAGFRHGLVPIPAVVQTWQWNYAWQSQRRSSIQIAATLESLGAELRWHWLCGELRCLVIIANDVDCQTKWVGKAEDLALLRNLSGLYGLVLRNIDASDEYLRALMGNCRIAYLVLDCHDRNRGGLSAEGISRLEKLPALTTLFLETPLDKPMCDALRRVSQTTRLQVLSCSGLRGELIAKLTPEFSYDRFDNGRLLLHLPFDGDVWNSVKSLRVEPLSKLFFVRRRGWGPGAGVCAETRACPPGNWLSDYLRYFRWLEEVDDLQSLTLIDLEKPVDPSVGESPTIAEVVFPILPRLTSVKSVSLNANDLSSDLVSAVSKMSSLEAIGLHDGTLDKTRFELLLNLFRSERDEARRYGLRNKTLSNLQVLYLGRDVDVSRQNYANLQKRLARVPSRTYHTVAVVREPCLPEEAEGTTSRGIGAGKGTGDI